jgi:hypothetical protein
MKIGQNLNKMNTKINYYERAASILAAIILLQTLYFKFTAAPVSVYIFQTLGIEPYGRIGTGVLELITGFLLIYRKTSVYGAILGIGIISGAILSHLFILGIVVENDGGYLFFLAIVVFVACLVSALLQFSTIKEIVTNFIFQKKYN